MKILVTGGAGFIGSHVVDGYVSAGHRVTVVDDLSTGKRANLNSKAGFIKDSILSSSLKQHFRRERFDVISHHAAQIDVRRSVADPLLDERINIQGLLHLLELARQFRVKKIILAASGGTYYGECRTPAQERQAPRPLSPYGVSKMASEAYLKAYKALHGIDFTVLRYGNVYGPRQDPHGEAGVVSIFSLAMLSNKKIRIFGNGRQQRDFVFVEDVAQANLWALTKGNGMAFNIGIQRAVSVNELFKCLKQITRYELRPVYRPARSGELQRSVLNISLAKKGLGWRPQHSLMDGLRETVEFFSRRRES